MTSRTGPLSHLRVLDLGRVVAAPWCTQIMADLGAEVIKIERPGVGDDTRGWGPPFLNDQEGQPTGEAGYYLAVNRGKRSVTVDMASPAGQAVLRRLAARSDVVVENFKAGALKRYGLDAASLREVNPALVYCSITGFGQDGPRAGQAAYDFAIQAMGGLMSVTGEREGRPGAGPQKVGIPIIDLMTGMYATVAILAALARRSETGDGETIDLAMLDVSAAMLANQAMNWITGGQAPARGGNRHPNIQPQDVFACADGHFVLAVGNDGQFARLCQVLGQPDMADDPRFAVNAGRVDNPELMARLEAAFAGFEKAELIARLEAAGVPCAPINDIAQVFADPQVAHRQMLRDLPHPLAGTVKQVVSPMRFHAAPLSYGQAAPLLGQHTRAVLSEAGLSPTQIDNLMAEGAI